MLVGTVGMRCRFINLWTCCDAHRKTELVLANERSLYCLQRCTRFRQLTSSFSHSIQDVFTGLSSPSWWTSLQTSLIFVSTPTPHVSCKHKAQLHTDGSQGLHATPPYVSSPLPPLTFPANTRFNCIQTDHKAVMSRIEKSLHALHDARLARPTPLPTATPPTPSSIGGDSAAAASMSLAPIAKVNQVRTAQQGI